MNYWERLQHPPLAEDDLFRHSLYRNLGRTPDWQFPDVLRGGGLRCVRLSIENYDDLWPLLAEDPSPHIDERFRVRPSMFEYTLFNRGTMPYSGKHGGADWLIIDSPEADEAYTAYDSPFMQGPLRLAEGERLLGILHLYELSRERYDGRQPNPFVGLQLASAAHGTGRAAVAIGLLERYVNETYETVRGVTANIDRDNKRSQHFFAKLGYEQSDTYYGDKEEFWVKQFG